MKTKFRCPKCKKEFVADVGASVEIMPCECGEYADVVEEVSDGMPRM